MVSIWWVIARMMGGGSFLLSMWTTLGAHLGTWQVAGRSLRKPLPFRHLVAQCGTLEDMSTQVTNPGTGLNGAAAAELRALREQKHMTMRSLSAASGIPLRSLTRLLGGQRPITFDPLCALADALEVSVSTIISRAEDRLREEQRVPQFSY